MFRNNQSTEKNNKNEVKEIVSKENNFWQWFLWILQEARIVDTRYSVKGSYVWLDWGYKIFRNIYSLAQDAYEQSGHNQMQFPTLIKEEIFLKETDFIRNFENDVFWVDREGTKALAKGERLALRPTSELIIYPMFNKWIRSWRDLPMKVFQNVSIFRCETNETRPLIRSRETIGFIEGHSAFATKEAALEFLKQVWKFYMKLFNDLGIPVKLIEVPEWECFAGSTKTIDGYVVLPESKSMELFTTAYLGTTFSEIFSIEYLDEQKTKQLAHLLCYGPSIDRIIASLIALYGDDRGLKLLPGIAPKNFIIIPIFNRKNRNAILSYARKVQKHLSTFGFTVELDDNEITRPGNKFYRSERFGYPLRIEVGQREYQNKEMTIIRRDTFQKLIFNLDTKNLKREIKKLLKQIRKTQQDIVFKDFIERQIDLTCYKTITEAFDHLLLETDRIYLINWCGRKVCAEKIESKTNFSLLGYDHESKTIQRLCIVCQSKGHQSVLAKRY
ncbi:MAG: proline--tRNA ligase [Candidatus Heimdallarchaeota archaeon]